MMRLSDVARTPARPRDFWAGLAGIGVLMGYVALTGHLPPIGHSRWLFGGAFLLVWVVMAFLLRHGRLAFSWQWVVSLAGGILFTGGWLWPHPPAASWAAFAGSVVMLAGGLSTLFEFGKPHDDSSGGRPDAAV